MEPLLERDFDSYLRAFDYDERRAMKIGLQKALDLYTKGEIQLVDIRFHEEQAAWSGDIGQQIPLNELPDRLDELDCEKTIVTMCPHYDRAEIGCLYLTLKGYSARYFTAGMLKLVDYLRGDKARDYMAQL